MKNKAGKMLLTMWVEKDFVEKLEEYQHDNRFQFRAHAAHDLMIWAINNKPKKGKGNAE